MTTTLHSRLKAARAGMTDPRLSGENPHFQSKFVPRDEVLSVVLPALAAEGLFLTQGVFDGELATTVWDDTGAHETLCRFPLPPITDPQKFLAACTYASRGSLMLAFALAGEPDDDGNTAAKAVKEQPATSPEGFDAITDSLTRHKDRIDGVKGALGLPKDAKLATTRGRKAWDDLPKNLQAKVALYAEGLIPSLD